MEVLDFIFFILKKIKKLDILNMLDFLFGLVKIFNIFGWMKKQFIVFILDLKVVVNLYHKLFHSVFFYVLQIKNEVHL